MSYSMPRKKNRSIKLTGHRVKRGGKGTINKDTSNKITSNNTNTNEKLKFHASNCSPTSEMNNNNKDYSCYSDEALTKMRDLWNKRHPDVQIKQDEPSAIWTGLKEGMADVCDTEACWLRQQFMENNGDKELLNYTFVPFSPKSWKKKPNEWLSSVDIEKVMQQYEKAYTCFVFLGPSPINFDKRVDAGGGGGKNKEQCVWDDLCGFDLKKQMEKSKNKIGMIFNTDPDYLPGSHWISLFINIKKKYIFFFNSTGEKAPKEIKELCDRIITQGKDLNIDLTFYENTLEHQKTNTECGMYSLHMIISLLTGKKMMEEFIDKRIPDKDVEALRQEYFMANSG